MDEYTKFKVASFAVCADFYAVALKVAGKSGAVVAHTNGEIEDMEQAADDHAAGSPGNGHGEEAEVEGHLDVGVSEQPTAMEQASWN